MLAAVDEQVEVPDRSVRNHRNRGPQPSAVGGLGVRTGTDVDLPVEDKGQPGQASRARHRVDRAAERLIQQGRGGGCGADLLAPGALGRREFLLAAEVSEM